METCTLVLALLPVLAAPSDPRQAPPRTTNTPVTEFDSFTAADWPTVGRPRVRERILAAAGLLPMPPKRLLNPRYGPAVEQNGIRIEPVALETLPGFWLGGNLYRPLESAPGSRPAVLTPHGHWARGRLHHDEVGSIPARCISLARQGYVVFAYDMVGYNDTGLAVSHRFAQNDRRAMLWGVSLGGLQTWNSIRALDFLLSLPEVDGDRVGVTGASGGGTQTFLLCAIDDRWAAAAPVNMISAHFQGGCLCENLPGLRLGGDAHNLQIAALAAPKPMLMVSCTGDWTANTPALEGPTVRRAYERYGVPERLEWVQFEAGHNYHRGSREAVYRFFGRWLLGADDPEQFTEQPLTVPSDEELLYFKDRQAPAGALDEAGLIAALIAERRAQFQALLPRDAADLERFRAAYLPALRQAVRPLPPPVWAGELPAEGPFEWLGEAGERLRGEVIAGTGRPVIVLAGDPTAVADLGRAAVWLAPFRQDPPRDALAEFATTYNPTLLTVRIGDLLGAAARFEAPLIVAVGEQAPLALLAAPFLPADAAVVVDLGGHDWAADDAWQGELWQPGLRRAGDLLTAAILAAPRTMVLTGVAPTFDFAPAERAAALTGGRLIVRAESLAPREALALLRPAP